MSGNNDNRLKRYDEQILPPSFRFLTEQQKAAYIQHLMEADLELRRVMQERLGKSQIAEQDLHVAINMIEMLQDERKVFSHTAKGETGSGTYELRVRGGDTKFIGSIALAVIAVALVVLVLIRVL